eukprot:COSAG06_NODE_1983_length_7920_cov_4.287303_7_plen_161_part_00
MPLKTVGKSATRLGDYYAIRSWNGAGCDVQCAIDRHLLQMLVASVRTWVVVAENIIYNIYNIYILLILTRFVMRRLSAGGFKLKSTKDKPKPKAGGGRGDLMQAIMSGTKLKKTRPAGESEEGDAAGGGGSGNEYGDGAFCPLILIMIYYSFIFFYIFQR